MRLVANRLLANSILVVLLGTCGPHAHARSPLVEYIRTPDPALGEFQVARVTQAGNLDVVESRFRSLRWPPADLGSSYDWNHGLIMAVPQKLTCKTALLRITAGGSADLLKPEMHPMLRKIAQDTGCVTAQLNTVPFQPIQFAGPKSPKRVEDDLVAYSWSKYLDSGDPRWLPRLPMTKAAVAAMDMLAEYVEKRSQVKVDAFVVTGESKRGWVTWLTPLVDQRVKAIVPVVIDLLNVKANFKHHFAVYEGWAPAIQDYVNHGITDRIETPEFTRLLELVDPYAYRKSLKVPKFVINAANDQFFLPDSSQFYFGQLEGPRMMRYVPNAGHSLRGSDYPETLYSYFSAFVRAAPLPTLRWVQDSPVSLRVVSDQVPAQVNLWVANNPSKRDFRMGSSYPAYARTELKLRQTRSFRVRLPRPEKGWNAVFVELVYRSRSSQTLKLTTDVYIMSQLSN